LVRPIHASTAIAAAIMTPPSAGTPFSNSARPPSASPMAATSFTVTHQNLTNPQFDVPASMSPV
jgi:hypothetical protein